MSNLKVTDGFDDYENDNVQDEERKPSSNRVIQGDRLSFTIDYKWLINDAEEFLKTRELVAYECHRYTQKWVDGLPQEHIFLAPHEPWPNIEQLNAKCAKSEWGEYQG
jgi:hypothetical protein